MGRAKCTFREADVKRSIRAARAVGLDVVRVEIATDGRIVLVTKQAGAPLSADDAERNEWDDVYATGKTEARK